MDSRVQNVQSFIVAQVFPFRTRAIYHELHQCMCIYAPRKYDKLDACIESVRALQRYRQRVQYLKLYYTVRESAQVAPLGCVETRLRSRLGLSLA
jgi:hypothetical protein